MSEGAQRCGGCGAPLALEARFCGRCGRVSAAHRAELRAELERRFVRGGRAGVSLGIVFGGVLAVLVGFGLMSDGASSPWLDVAAQGAQWVVGLVACVVLGRGALRASLPLAARPRDFGWATLGGLATFGFAWLYIRSLGALFGAPDEPAVEFDFVLPSVLSVLVLAPLIEEWLCRGVLWQALERTSGRATTLLLSAALFALLHGLEGWVFALPHRFVLGLGAGWLRARTGSLAPAIWIHFVHNALAFAYANES